MAIDICADHPSAFWNRKKHIVTLPYEDDFSEKNIPTKSRPCQMNSALVEFCKKEIHNLLQKGLIKPSNLTNLVKTIKERVKFLPCLTLANPAWPKIVEADRRHGLWWNSAD
ncbi:hypothetical protein H5410_051459 [Solanum commersonii]|uniref:Uncharacterized protein n=1 Tax=Solanum commersonii TaxID=4109 RepID=A0A9J5X117_SOLCO|nr:hypothetical protein H5410_051459 [Solanum commersonii]